MILVLILYKTLENHFIDGLLEQQGVDISEMIDEYGEYDELNEMREQMKIAYKESTTAITRTSDNV